MILKSNKYICYSLIIVVSALFIFIAVKAYDEYIFYINNRPLKQITNTQQPYKILPKKTVDQDEEVEKIISDFVTDNKYDIEPTKPIVTEAAKPVAETKKIEELQEEKTDVIVEANKPEIVQPKNQISPQEKNVITLKTEDEKHKDNLVQLGAYSNKENIANSVKKLKLTFPLLLEDKKFFVKSSNGSLYKLYVGPFDSSTEAREFCSTLRKNGVSCFFIQL